ncbi:MAG: OmpA family protein [Bacteroidales bacterium]|nr:OmpA family protein [Bacteroidales bacterium]
MKKLFVLIAAVALMAPAFAQETKVTRTEDENTITVVEETPTANGRIVTTTVLEKNSVFTNGFWHNWQLDAGIGTQMYYGDNDWKVAKKVPEMFTFPTIDLYLTKWISPSFGVGLGANWSKFKGLYQTTPGHSNNYRDANANFRDDKNIQYYTKADSKYDSEHLAVQSGSYLDVFALAHADITTIFGGYKPDRFYNLDAYAGGGLIYGFCKSGNIPSASFNTGLINTFRLTEQLRLMLNVRGALVGDDFDGESYLDEPTRNHWLLNHKLDGIFGVTAGLAWNIGKEYSKWRLAERTSVYQYDKETVEKIIKEVVPAPDPQIIREVPEVWFHINFIIDRWDISKKELINIHAVSDLIKSTPNTKYLICGYADKQTATPAHNLMLSENRAKAVYNVMVNEFGVNPEQLVMDYKGGVDYMFYNMKELSRCTMITSIKE